MINQQIANEWIRKKTKSTNDMFIVGHSKRDWLARLRGVRAESIVANFENGTETHINFLNFLFIKYIYEIHSKYNRHFKSSLYF